MIQKTIRDWGGVEFSTTEGAEQQTEWNDRTVYGVDGYNSIAELGANQAPMKVKTDFITVSQDVDLDTMESDISTNSGKLTYPAPDATKVGFISITQAVDLDAMETKLATIETNATIDQTDAEIRTAVEAATDSNVFTDADHTQLATNKTNADASKVKTDFITVTQAVDLDTMESGIATNVSDIADRESLFQTPITSAGNYTTANKDSDTKKTVYMTSGTTLTLSSTGLTVDFQQQLFNSTGGDVTISSTDTIEGENVALTAGSFVYYTLVSAGVWLLSVGGKTEAAEWAIAVSDETTALTTGTAKTTFRMPFAMTVTEVRASVTTAPTGSVLTVDINDSGTTILSTKITIDATEKTSTTAATDSVISDSALANDAEITIDIDGVGSSVAGAGLKVLLIGTRS